MLERDIHDGVQQQLVTMLSLVELASHQAARDPQAAARTMVEVAEVARTSITDLRELVRGYPASGPAGRRTGRRPGEPDGEAPCRRPDEFHRGRALGTGRGVRGLLRRQRGVTNALKHAPGSRVAVLLADVQGALQVEVRDDGPGFGAPSASARGLTGLRDRVESFGGSFVVRSAPGDGTCVRRLSLERWCDAWCCDS